MKQVIATLLGFIVFMVCIIGLHQWISEPPTLPYRVEYTDMRKDNVAIYLPTTIALNSQQREAVAGFIQKQANFGEKRVTRFYDSSNFIVIDAKLGAIQASVIGSDTVRFIRENYYPEFTGQKRLRTDSSWECCRPNLDIVDYD
jgi:hypothetical protein